MKVGYTIFYSFSKGDVATNLKLLATTPLQSSPAINTTGYLPTTSSALIQSSIPTITVSITDDMNNDTAQPSVATTFNYIIVSDISFVITPIQVVTNSESEETAQKGSNPTAITLAALASVIGLLILLLIGICGFFFFFFFDRKCKQSSPEAPQNQNASATELTLHDESNSIPTSANSCYQKCSSLLIYELPNLAPADYCYPEVYYSEIRNDRGSGLYDDTIVATHYDIIPEAAETSSEEGSDLGRSILTASITINQSKN